MALTGARIERSVCCSKHRKASLARAERAEVRLAHETRQYISLPLSVSVTSSEDPRMGKNKEGGGIRGKIWTS